MQILLTKLWMISAVEFDGRLSNCFHQTHQGIMLLMYWSEADIGDARTRNKLSN